jgi:hypothetical protein
MMVCLSSLSKTRRFLVVATPVLGVTGPNRRETLFSILSEKIKYLYFISTIIGYF